MSIRTKLLLPLLALLALGIGLAGLIGMRSLSAFSELSALSERTIEADEASRAARDGFEKGEQLLARVLAMTDLIDPKTVETGFKASAERLASELSGLKAAARSERMGALSQEAGVAAARWQADAEILLGIRTAEEIPTTELLGRHSLTLRKALNDAVALAGQEARTETAAAGASLAAQVWTMLGLGMLLAACGAACALWLTGNVAKPLTRLVADADRLASGDVSVAFVGLERRDEIGGVARAIAGFRDGVVERARLSEASGTEQGARLERGQRVEALVRCFEEEVGATLGLFDRTISGMGASAERLGDVVQAMQHEAAGATAASET